MAFNYSGINFLSNFRNFFTSNFTVISPKRQHPNDGTKRQQPNAITQTTAPKCPAATSTFKYSIHAIIYGRLQCHYPVWYSFTMHLPITSKFCRQIITIKWVICQQWTMKLATPNNTKNTTTQNTINILNVKNNFKKVDIFVVKVLGTERSNQKTDIRFVIGDPKNRGGHIL